MILKEKKHNLDKFNEIYEKDRFLARVYAMEKTPYVEYTILNETDKNVFQIFWTTHKYNVSTSLRRYVRTVTQKKVFVNKNKFYFQQQTKGLTQLRLEHLSDDVLPLFIERFSWISFLKEENISEITFNSIVRHKLYSKEKVLKHLFKAPANVVSAIRSNVDYWRWKRILPSCHNVENVNVELFNDLYYLEDACSMAFKLNEKINLAWSLRRLKEEHDRWSKTFTKYVIELDNEPLNNRQIFIDFNDFIGGGLLTQSAELAGEGFRQHHCVASYKYRVNNGECSIFHINGFTAEVRFIGFNKISLNQFKGYRNCNAPDDMRNELIEKIKTFNELVKDRKYKQHQKNEELEMEEIELPF
jgi:hypothetical protein